MHISHGINENKLCHIQFKIKNSKQIWRYKTSLTSACEKMKYFHYYVFLLLNIFTRYQILGSVMIQIKNSCRLHILDIFQP